MCDASVRVRRTGNLIKLACAVLIYRDSSRCERFTLEETSDYRCHLEKLNTIHTGLGDISSVPAPSFCLYQRFLMDNSFKRIGGDVSLNVPSISYVR